MGPKAFFKKNKTKKQKIIKKEIETGKQKQKYSEIKNNATWAGPSWSFLQASGC
jgi:predicted RNA-binding protein